MKLNLLLISGISFLLLQSTPGAALAQGAKPKYDPEKAQAAWKAATAAADSGNLEIAGSNLLKMTETTYPAKGEKFADAMLDAIKVNLKDYMRQAEAKKDWPQAERMASNLLKYYEMVGDTNNPDYKFTQNELRFVQRLLGKAPGTAVR
jgi:hypothetical protein